MAATKRALTFDCAGSQLVGVLDIPVHAPRRAVLVVVGGPQYRAGSHRQFTLLARSLAEQGIAAMRFDYRGMGDSEGAVRDFEDVGADIGAAIDALYAALPSVREVVLWGLCDGASAAMLYAPGDARVRALVLLNPWARTEAGLAQATLKTYYRARLFDPGLWKKILSGRFNAGAAFASLVGLLRKARRASAAGSAGASAAPLPERLRAALAGFDGRVLLITSEADLTAQEFIVASAAWQDLLPEHLRLAGADHTCSRAAWRDQVARWTADWVVR